ncbi:MAG: hypothetical protein ACJ8AW_44780 [Rhodopila sp.]
MIDTSHGTHQDTSTYWLRTVLESCNDQIVIDGIAQCEYWWSLGVKVEAEKPLYLVILLSKQKGVKMGR